MDGEDEDSPRGEQPKSSGRKREIQRRMHTIAEKIHTSPEVKQRRDFLIENWLLYAARLYRKFRQLEAFLAKLPATAEEKITFKDIKNWIHAADGDDAADGDAVHAGLVVEATAQKLFGRLNAMVPNDGRTEAKYKDEDDILLSKVELKMNAGKCLSSFGSADHHEVLVLTRVAMDSDEFYYAVVEERKERVEAAERAARVFLGLEEKAQCWKKSDEFWRQRNGKEEDEEERKERISRSGYNVQDLEDDAKQMLGKDIACLHLEFVDSGTHSAKRHTWTFRPDKSGPRVPSIYSACLSQWLTVCYSP
eukprot:COSAG01_NODE_12134_length_1795_cov_7.524764_1_plen_306_part_10